MPSTSPRHRPARIEGGLDREHDVPANDDAGYIGRRRYTAAAGGEEGAPARPATSEGIGGACIRRLTQRHRRALVSRIVTTRPSRARSSSGAPGNRRSCVTSTRLLPARCRASKNAGSPRRYRCRGFRSAHRPAAAAGRRRARAQWRRAGAGRRKARSAMAGKVARPTARALPPAGGSAPAPPIPASTSRISTLASSALPGGRRCWNMKPISPIPDLTIQLRQLRNGAPLQPVASCVGRVQAAEQARRWGCPAARGP